MKNYIAMMCCSLMALMSWAAPIKESEKMGSHEMKIMVISDPHLLAPSLHDEGRAAQNLASSDMKLVLESNMIVGRMVDEIIKEKPHLLLITGDLTFNGARASHERIVSHLARLAQSGVRTLVIPGNHDVKCPYSKSYTGESPESVATVTSEEFAQLYAQFGYGAESERDPNSLSYTCEPVSGLVLLCIDSNRYDANRLGIDGEKVVYHNDGTVRPETLEWIRQQLAKAQAEGKRVLAMMHHHLVEHIDGEAKVLPNYIVANHKEVAQVLRDGGVKIVLTGHLHITDAASDGGIVDVATGSASTYPLPMRTLTIDADSLRVETRFFDGIEENLLEQGRLKVANSAGAVAGLVSRRLWSKMSGRMEQLKQMLEMQGAEVSRLPQNAQEFSELLLRHMREPLAQSMVRVTCGGEDPKQASAVIEAVKQGVKGMMCEIIPDGGEMIAEFLIDELMPRFEPSLRSALEDLNHVGSKEESSTNDHRLSVRF